MNEWAKESMKRVEVISISNLHNKPISWLEKFTIKIIFDNELRNLHSFFYGMMFCVLWHSQWTWFICGKCLSLLICLYNNFLLPKEHFTHFTMCRQIFFRSLLFSYGKTIFDRKQDDIKMWKGISKLLCHRERRLDEPKMRNGWLKDLFVFGSMERIF